MATGRPPADDDRHRANGTTPSDTGDAGTSRSRGPRDWWASVRPGPGVLGPAAGAGLPGAIGGVPDGMAAATLVGVNPIHGLYAAAVGRIAGGLTASSQLMVVTTTSAAALAAGSALSSIPSEDRLTSLFLLTLLAGIAMLLAGLFGLGRLTGFVSHSVMMGFLTGVAVNIVLGQFEDLAGVEVDGGSATGRAVQVVLHPGQWHLPTLLVGILAIALLVTLARTRLSGIAAVVALVVTSLLVLALGSDGGVALVRDAGDIPRGLPLPALPRLRMLSLDLVTGAIAVAVIVLVQGAGVAESAPNPDGRRPDADQDFASQGIANITAGLFRGIPVGGSVGQTAINIGAGASSRWAAIASGVWILVVLVALSPLVGAVPSATLAAVLVVASVGGISPARIATVWRAGPQSQIAMVTTFVATLFLPVAAAVGIGAALSLLLQVNRESMDVRVVELVQRDGQVIEQPPPAQLSDEHVTILDVHGSMFYAGARALESVLPEPGTAATPIVVLRLRGRATLGATAFTVLASYAHRLGEVGGRLYVSGVDADLAGEFDHVIDIDAAERIEVFPASPVLGESTRSAVDHAHAWLVQQHPELAAEEVHPTGPSPLTRLWRWLRTLLRGGD